MRKIVIAISLLLGLTNAKAQAEFYADGKKVTTCNISAGELKVKVPVPSELKEYKHAALAIKVFHIDGENTEEYGVFKTHLSKDERESGFVEAFVMKKDGTSDFGSGLITWEGEVMFTSPFSTINMRKWNSDEGRLYSSVKIEVLIYKGVPTKKWDADKGVHYTEFPYEKVKSFDGSCKVELDAPSEAFRAKTIPISFANKYAKGKVDLYDFDKKSIDMGGNSVDYKRSIYYVDCGERENHTKHTYEVVALPLTAATAEDIKKDLYAYWYYRANKETKSSNPFSAFGDFGKKIGSKKEESTTKAEKPDAAIIKWYSLLNENVKIIFPGLYAQDTDVEAAATLKEKCPEVPEWKQLELGGKQVWLFEGSGIYSNQTIPTGSEEVSMISVFVVEIGDQVIVGLFSADDLTRRKHNADFTKSLLEDINKTLKFL